MNDAPDSPASATENEIIWQDALIRRLRFYRDLGITDFYRRETPAELQAALARSASAAVSAQPSPAGAANTAVQEAAISPKPPTTLFTPSRVVLEPAARPAALEQLRAEIGDCTRCKLHAGRNKLVFGDGNPSARLMFVGEGPGADEDAQGIPFVGRGGQLLNNMISAMGLRREEVYIANVVKCRPPGNRTPEADEGATCSPFLMRQIEIVSPEVVVALGQTAVTWLTGQKRPLNAWRGTLHSVLGAKLIVTFHPAYLLRDPNQKKFAWEDLQLAMRELGLRAPQRG